MTTRWTKTRRNLFQSGRAASTKQAPPGNNPRAVAAPIAEEGCVTGRAEAADSASIHTKTGDEAEEQKLHQAIDAEGAIAGEETKLTP